MATIQPSFCVVDRAVKTLKKISEYVQTGMETTLDLAQDAVDEKVTCTKNIKELTKIMYECTSMERDIQQILLSVDFMKERVQSGDDRDLETIFDAKLTQEQTDSRLVDLREHTKYRDLMLKLDELEQPAGEGVQRTLLEDGMVMTQEVHTKCPFTGKEMTEPVCNKICGHHYDLSGVKQMMRNRKGKAKCPVSGCANEKPIASCDLQEDKKMKKLIDKKIRQAAKSSKKR